jgi:predicted secreted protein
MQIRRQLLVASLFLAAACSATRGAEAAPPANVLNLTATATLEVTQDLLTITLQAVREGTDAAAVQAGLKQTLDAALAEARKAAAPGALQVRTGNFSIHPRFGKDGKTNGWQGSAELVLEGKDLQRVAQTAGRLNATMNIIGVSQSLSRELAAQHESEVTAQAIQKFRARASELARQFGFGGYTLREVTVQSSEGFPSPRPMMRIRADAMMASAESALPVEAGKGLVTATVSGSVELQK